MPLHRNKSKNAADSEMSLPQAGLPPRSSSTSKYDSLKNGSQSPKLRAEFLKETPQKKSKSTFYTEPERVYPSSCVHAPQSASAFSKNLAISCIDLTEEATLSKSVSIPNLHSKSQSAKRKTQKNDKYATMRSTGSQKFFTSMRRKPGSRFEISDSASDDCSDVSSIGSRKVLNSEASNNNSPETFYISYDNLFESKSLTSPGAGQTIDECLQTTSFYKGDVQREVGESGAVVPIVGCDVTLHLPARPPVVLSPNCPTCLLSSNVKLTRHRHTSAVVTQHQRNYKKHGKKSTNSVTRSVSDKLKEIGPKLIDYDCPTVRDEILDERILLGLEDPPNCFTLSDNFELYLKKKNFHRKDEIWFAIAGPAVHLDLKDKRVIQRGVVIQLPINVVMFDPERQKSFNNRFSQSEVNSNITCLQSTAQDGVYREVESCFECFDTLQVTLDTSQFFSPMQSSSNSCEVFVVPVVKRSHLSSGSVWDGILRKTFCVGIYGSRYSYGKNTYCVSVSSSGFNPPFFKLYYENNTHLTLRLLHSFAIQTYHVQGYQMNVKTSSPAIMLDKDLSECIFSKADLLTEARIIQTFTLKHDFENPILAETWNSSENYKFTVELIGLGDGNTFKMKCDCPEYRGNDFPRGLSTQATKRLSESMETSPRAMVESTLHDTSFQWILGLLEDRSLFRKQFVIPVSKRKVFGIKLAVALKSSSASKKKNPYLPTYFLHYSVDDYLPVLSKYSLLMIDNSGKKKEWWICYHKHRLGLVRTTSVKILDFEEFSTWNQVRIEIGKVVEAITAPVLALKCDLPHIQEKLHSQINNWALFSAAMSYGEAFATNSINKERNEKLKEQKISFYLQKLLDYRTNSGKIGQFHYDVMKALLYSEHYKLATELAADLALLNTAINVDEVNWPHLASWLVGRAAEEDFKNFLQQHTQNEEPWRPFYDYLCKWRERFADNHEGVLFALHQAVGHLPSENSYSAQQVLTDLVILVRTFETLCQFDTNL